MKDALENLLELSRRKILFMPEMFDLKKTDDIRRLRKLIGLKKILHIIDDFPEQLKELFAINNPTEVYKPNFSVKFKNYLEHLSKKTDLSKQGKWVYYPWNATVVHILHDLDFQRVRTARNRNLISEQEQQKFYGAVVGIGGLSVGNSVALSIVLQGGARHIRLADFDRLALSNLNRIRASVSNLGQLKVEITARQIYELNPYAKVEIIPEGLTAKNIKKFFLGPDKLDIVVDELDSMGVKYLIRQEAKKYKIPVAMGADNGDNAILDIERYDNKKQPKFFHNRLGNISYEGLINLDKFATGRTITQFLGPENITEKMQNSLLQMGKTIVSWPQLGGAALLNGVGVAYSVRKIANGESLESNRAIISLDEKLIPNFNAKMEKKKRRNVTKKFKIMFNLK